MSVEDAVRAAVEQHNKPEPVEPVVDPVEPTTDPVEPVVGDEPPAKPGRTANRLRGEDGRLLPGKKAAPEGPTDPVVETPSAQAIPPEAAPDIPKSLKAAFKAQWGTLSPEWRAEIARIDQAGIAGGEHLRTSARFGDEVMNIVKPYEALIASENGTPAGAIKDLLQTAALFRQGSPEQKTQALMQIARQFNVTIPGAQSVDPALLQPGADSLLQRLPVQFDPTQHPAIKAMLEKNQRFESYFDRIEKSQQEGNLNDVNTFLSQKDANGNALYPMDESLEQAFAEEIGAVRSAHPDWPNKDVLKTAHEQLSWKTPEIREVMLARRDAEAEAKRKADTQKALEAKKRASGSLTGAPTTSGAPTGGSIRDIVAAQVHGTGRI